MKTLKTPKCALFHANVPFLSHEMCLRVYYESKINRPGATGVCVCVCVCVRVCVGWGGGGGVTPRPL